MTAWLTAEPSSAVSPRPPRATTRSSASSNCRSATASRRPSVTSTSQTSASCSSERSLRSGDEQEYYFVIETKSIDNLDDGKALTNSERWKIKCALKHFDALQIEAKLDYRPYLAPVKDYRADFKGKVPTP